MSVLSRLSCLAQAVRPCEGLAQQALGSLYAAKPFTTSSTASSSVSQTDITDEWFMRQRQVITLGNRVPTTAPDVWVAPNAVIVGDVDLLDRVNIWYGAVLRGDLNNITIGSNSTIQDRTVIHAARTSPSGLSAATVVGKNVVVGPNCVLRSCRIDDNVIIGAKSSLMEGSFVEENAILAPGSVLPPARRVPSGELWAGNPAKFVRKLTKDEKTSIAELAASVRAVGVKHWTENLPHGTAWRDVEDFRAANIKAGNHDEIDFRSERYSARVEAEKEAAEKLT